MPVTDQLTRWIQSFAHQIPPEDARDGRLKRLARGAMLAPVNRLVKLSIPFAARAGFRIEALEPGYLRARMPLKGNRNHIGTMYAGALFTLAEIPGGVMTLFDFGSDFIPILKELNMRYLKPARSDVTVAFHLPDEEVERITRETRALGKAEFTLEGALTDGAGDVVARSTALYQVRLREASSSVSR